MDPITTAALISGGASLISSIGGYISGNRQLNKNIAYSEDAQRLQNEANLKIADDYNKAQKDLAKYQNEYNTMMWEKQNAYNSPEATIKRLTEAGINPRAYQQIGQFANAGSPLPAATPDHKIAQYVEPKMASLQLRSQKLALRNQFTEQKIRAVELTSDYILKSKQLEEQRRHNFALEGLSQQRVDESMRHNQAVEAVDNFNMMMQDHEFRLALAKAGIKQHADGTYTIPHGDIRLDQKYKQKLIDNLEKRGVKLETEKDYLEQKKELENLKTGIAWVDVLARVLAAIL